MRNLILPLIVICIGFLSCNNPSSHKNSETISIPDTAGYFAARHMKGLGSFKIGESTYSEILNLIKEEIRKDSRRFKETNYKEMPRYSGYQEKYLDYKFDTKGNIASQFYREDFGSIFKEIKYDTISNYLKDDLLKREIFGCPDIRELEIFEYYISDIEINSLKLKFYKDTICQISCSQNDKIEEGFKAKYGDGNQISNSLWKTPYGETYVRPEDDKVLQKSKLLKIDEIIFWENESLKAVSQTYCEYKYEGDKYQGAGYSNSYFTISLKDDKIVSQIKDCENEADVTHKRIVKQGKERDINKL